MGLLNLPLEVQRSILDYVSSNVSLSSSVRLHGLLFVSLLTTVLLPSVRALFGHETSSFIVVLSCTNFSTAVDGTCITWCYHLTASSMMILNLQASLKSTYLARHQAYAHHSLQSWLILIEQEHQAQQNDRFHLILRLPKARE